MTKAPNVVLIFTDNQQASTLGCYGNDEIYTPHLDKMSSQGLTFDNAFCPNAFCSPCRASLLTGMLPSQHGVHSWIDDRKSDDWPRGWHALNGMNTLPTLLQSSGYSTALIGKYHLGEPTSPAEGFDHWVTLEDGHVRSFYKNQIFDNGKVYEQPGHSVDFFSQKAIEFMEQEVAADNPFFLYLPYPAPYGHWPATKEEKECRFSERYEDCPIASVPRQGLNKKAVDGYLQTQASSTADLDFSMLMRAPNDLATLRNYYAQVSMVDDGVGQIIAALDRLGIEDDTLLIFTTDHGLSVGQHGFWGHGGSCFPSNLHRAAHSIPLIIRHKGAIQEGERSPLMVSNMDLFSTVLDYVGVGRPDNFEGLPSRSIAHVLKGEALGDWGDDAVYSEQEETRVVRTPQWAYFSRFKIEGIPELGNELYNIAHDPLETTDLSGKEEHAAVEAKLHSMIEVFFAQYVHEEADLWSGGVPVQNTIRPKFWREVWGEDWAPVYTYSDD